MPPQIPNPLTALRLLLLPGLWVFALLNWPISLGLGLFVASLSDVGDGMLARRYPQFTNGQFDSLADKLLTFSVALWLVMLKPQLFTQHTLILLCAALAYFAALFVGWRKFGHVSTLHLHSGKWGGLTQAVFVLHAFLFGGYSVVLFYIAVGSFILAALEELAIQLTHTELDDERLRSILPYLRQRLK